VVHIGFDLDSEDLTARQTSQAGDLGARYTKRKYIQLPKGENIPLQVIAYASRSYCEWVIDITTQSGGRVETLTVSDHGRPFRTTALATRYTAEYELLMTEFPNRWVDIDPVDRS
jgi:hypothetical protein